MGWGGPGGLTGEAAVREEKELQELLERWLAVGVITGGEIAWDPQEGAHWVTVTAGSEEKRVMSAREFEAYAQGLEDGFGAKGVQS
jgi:hypothetical protein